MRSVYLGPDVRGVSTGHGDGWRVSVAAARGLDDVWERKPSCGQQTTGGGVPFTAVR